MTWTYYKVNVAVREGGEKVGRVIVGIKSSRVGSKAAKVKKNNVVNWCTCIIVQTNP